MSHSMGAIPPSASHLMAALTAARPLQQAVVAAAAAAQPATGQAQVSSSPSMSPSTMLLILGGIGVAAYFVMRKRPAAEAGDTP